MSRNCQKRLTQKEDQIKSAVDPEIQIGVAGTLARAFPLKKGKALGTRLLGLNPKFANAEKYNKKAS